MKDLRILFMGTPDFAVGSLEAILNADFNVVGVITAPDRPAGRGQKLKQSAVKKFALSKNLPVLQPSNLKAEDFLEKLKNLQANVQVVVAFRMLPKVVWKMPKFGTFNLHASLLPQYRGAAPINWALINGEEKTGVTTFFIDDKIDTGEIILQQEIKVNPKTTAGSLHDELMESGASLVTETLKRIQSDKLKPTEQKEITNLKPAPKLNRENTKIDWQVPVGKIYNLIRGLNPYPAAWCYLINNGKEELVKIFGCEIAEEEHNQSYGDISIENAKIKVASKEGFIYIDEIQLSGKRKMHTKSLLNGFKFASDAKMR